MTPTEGGRYEVPPAAPGDFPPVMLVGRLPELEFLRAFVSEAAVTGGILVVSGEPGVGKSTLLDAADEYTRASGATVLRVAGTELEGQLSYAALNQALYPLVDEFDQLNTAQRDALQVALGFGDGPPPGQLLVSNAAAVLLRRAAARSPLLLIVDDMPWIDRASAGVLSFVARRLAGSRAGLLVASRTGEDQGFFDRAGLPEYELKPLDDTAAGQLLAARFPDLHATVKARILDTAQGIPLALLELPRTLSQSQRTAGEPLPAVLPLGQHLQRHFVSRVAKLPDATKKLLLTAALEGTGDLAVLEAANDGAYRIDDLAPAERDRLVQVKEHSHRVVFRHPLIRSAVVEATTSAERRSAHRRLATILVNQPEHRAWHLGEATVEPDEQVAAVLEEAAHTVVARGDYTSAVALLTRASDLSPSSAERGRRLAAAAYIGAEAMGEVRSTAELLEGSRRASSQASSSLHYASAATLVMLNSDAHIDTAHRMMVSAIEGSQDRGDADPVELVNGLATLLLICFFGGRSELWQPLYAALGRLSHEPPPSLTLTLDMVADPARTGVAALPRLQAALQAARDGTNSHQVQSIAEAAWYADRLAELREPLWRAVLQGREGGPARRHLVALMDICVDDFHRGRWDEAAELAAEGLSLTEEGGGRFFGWYFRYHQALLAAVMGRFETSRALAEQMIGWAGPRGVGTARIFAHHALVLGDLGRGDFESAYHHATTVSPAGTLASHVPHCLWITMDLVEAAVRTDPRAEADRHVRAMQDARLSELSPRLAILAAGSAGIAAADEDAPALFEEALNLPTIDQWPFDVARVRLAYGERLRRARSLTEAKVQLQGALAAFRTLGADPWTARAERELRAAGLASTQSAPDISNLTAQELQIATLAASGLTNKEIAAKLYLSPRTVSGHLYRIFPKLGITTRAALRDALGTDPNSSG
ncbi:AAA family ATPase [Kribbella sp. VKM Ac-2568]|uniref:ATP-binding protein n=1 Tax=Kribbella sp. VKM Ac-2568 TaxID=2512219 RepID=UPI0010D45A05|nr:AAA family ATPase [Kribbella sp. VKM Ac-2568]TCM46549.1 regulatory LuxR family protein [Kribbella sp. VKM Ac-2568]